MTLDDWWNWRSHWYHQKNGSEKAVSDSILREKLIEELADVLMYYNDVLLCYGITTDELKHSYTNKFKKNMTRW